MYKRQNQYIAFSVLLAVFVGLLVYLQAEAASSGGKQMITIQTQSGGIQFTWDNTYKDWRAKYKLPGWSGPHYKDTLPELANGEVYLVVEKGLLGYSKSRAPAASQIQALKWLLSRPDSENETVIRAIYNEYPKLKQSLVKYFDSNDLNSLYPPVKNLDDMRKLVSLVRVYFYEEHKNGLPYIAFDLDCHWDVEHGIKVMINGDRVVAVGSNGDDTYYIKKDGGKL